MIDLVSRLSKKDFNVENFSKKIEEEGYVIVEDLVNGQLVDKLKDELKNAIEIEDKFHGTSNRKDHAMLLACPIYGGAFLDLLEVKEFIDPFDWILGETSIIYVYTSSSMPPQSTNYSNRIHVDRPHFIPGYTEALGCLVMLDDFTEDNGATWILPQSHKQADEPSRDYFYKHAIRATGKKGSVIYFHLRLWHSGGDNMTDKWRHSVGIGFVKGYLKQRIDLPRAMKDVYINHLSDRAKQKLGFFSQPPSSLEEYYAIGEKRTYKQKSEWDKS